MKERRGLNSLARADIVEQDTTSKKGVNITQYHGLIDFASHITRINAILEQYLRKQRYSSSAAKQQRFANVKVADLCLFLNWSQNK